MLAMPLRGYEVLPMSKVEELRKIIEEEVRWEIHAMQALDLFEKAVRDEIVADIKEVYMRTGTWHSPATVRLPPAQRLVREEQEIGREQVRDEIAALIARYCP